MSSATPSSAAKPAALAIASSSPKRPLARVSRPKTLHRRVFGPPRSRRGRGRWRSPSRRPQGRRGNSRRRQKFRRARTTPGAAQALPGIRRGARECAGRSAGGFYAARRHSRASLSLERRSCSHSSRARENFFQVRGKAARRPDLEFAPLPDEQRFVLELRRGAQPLGQHHPPLGIEAQNLARRQQRGRKVLAFGRIERHGVQHRLDFVDQPLPAAVERGLVEARVQKRLETGRGEKARNGAGSEMRPLASKRLRCWERKRSTIGPLFAPRARTAQSGVFAPRQVGLIAAFRWDALGYHGTIWASTNSRRTQLRRAGFPAY